MIGEKCEHNAIISGVGTKCLLDSGSQVSIISKSFYDKFLKSSHQLKTLNELVEFESANGSAIPYEGYIEAKLILNGFNNNTSVDALLLVSPDTDYSSKTPLLVGTNVLKGSKFPENGNFPYIKGVVESMKKSEEFYDCETGRIGSVMTFTSQRITVKPNEVVNINCFAHSTSVKESFPALIDSAVESSDLPGGLIVQSKLVTSRGNRKFRTKVSVQNISEREITIMPKSHLADVYLPQWIRPVGQDAKAKSKKSENVAYSHKVEVKGISPKDSSMFDNCKFDPSLSPEMVKECVELLKRNHDVFSKHDLDFGETDKIEHEINLTSDIPFKERSRPVPFSELEELRRHLQDLIEAGIIEESYSPYASAIVIVRKRSGELRLTGDFRKLNQITVKDAYRIPPIEEAFSRLAGSKWFSTMDLKSGYYQVRLRCLDRDKTSFVCPLGSYRYIKMPQGVTNGPATFQRLMEKCLGTLNLKQVLAFLDDIICFTATFEEHKEQLQRIFDRLRSYGLKLSLDKCEFFQKSVSYLGHQISDKGIGTSNAKIVAVESWPRPENQIQLKSWIGFASYYRRFIRNFSKISAPLQELLKGYTKKFHDGRVKVDRKVARLSFNEKWTNECEIAFKDLKEKLITAPILKIADYKQPYVLHTDASRQGLGATLSQMEDGVLRPVAYASRSVKKSEKNYPPHKLEYLALHWSVSEKFHDYLYGSKFTVKTDNNPLTYVLTSAKLDATGHRWLADLSTYDFDIFYRAGIHAQDADGLSRRPHDTELSSESDSQIDERISSMFNRVHQEVPEELVVSAVAVCNTVSLSQSVPLIESLPVNINVVMELDDRPPDNMTILTVEELKDAQSKDSDIQRVIELLESCPLPLTSSQRKEETKPVQGMLRNHSSFFLHQGVLYKKSELGKRVKYRLVLPRSLKKIALHGIHDDVGHLSFDRVIDLARERFYWFKLEEDVKEYLKNCRACILRKVKDPKAAPMKHLESTGPMDLVCIDFLSIEPDSSNRTEVLVITDHFTRFSRAIPTKNQTAKQVGEVLWKEFFLDFGWPNRLHSDRGASFTGKLAKELHKMANVNISLSAPHHPPSNGQCERFNRTLLDMIATLEIEKKKNWSKHLKYLTHAYNCTKNDSTKFSPFELMFGRQPRLLVDWYFNIFRSEEPIEYSKYVEDFKARLDEAYKLAQRHAEKSAGRNKDRYDKRVKESKLKVGDRVLIRNVNLRGKHKLANHWCSDVYIIDKLLGDVVYSVSSEDGTVKNRIFHRNLLLPCGFLPLVLNGA